MTSDSSNIHVKFLIISESLCLFNCPVKRNGSNFVQSHKRESKVECLIFNLLIFNKSRHYKYVFLFSKENKTLDSIQIVAKDNLHEMSNLIIRGK